MKKILYPLVLTFAWALFSPASFSQTYDIYGADVPANPSDANSGIPIIVGTKFYVTQIGQITSVRVHRGSSNTGTFVAHIWLDNGDNTGTLLTSQSFTPGTLNGWNTIDIPDVTVTPGNAYVVSYYSSAGTYGSTLGYFNQGFDLPNSTNGIYGYDVSTSPTPGNGVYISGPATTNEFPNSFFAPFGSGYYIDAVFDPLFTLPVSLVEFKAVANSKNVELSWKTQTEDNNKGFELQRSNNNKDWYTIGFINGAGNSSIEKSYAFTDKELAPGRYYYRLNQKDYDGNSKASGIVTAMISGKGTISLFQNAPNPVRGQTIIRYDLPEVQKVRLSVVDLSGREIKVLVDSKEQPGSHVVTLDAAAAGLSKQFYILRLQTDTETITRKMVVE